MPPNPNHALWQRHKAHLAKHNGYDGDHNMQEYAHKIEHCLAEASQQPSSPAAALLRKWTCELSSLRVFLALGHLKKYLSFCSVRLDGTAGPSAPQLTDAWYHELLVGSYTATEKQCCWTASYLSCDQFTILWTQFS